MTADFESRVRQRAHEIWEREGRPEGRDREHWKQAEAELQAENRKSAAKEPKAAKARPAAKPSGEEPAARKQAAKTTGEAAKKVGRSKAKAG